MGDWMAPRAGLNAVEKISISFLQQKLILSSSDIQSVA
jgi:hypothetical protein